MHANTIYSKTKAIAVLAVAFLMIVTASAIVMSSESSADAADTYTVTVIKTSESGSDMTSTFKGVPDGKLVRIDEKDASKIRVNVASTSMSLPEDTDRYHYEFSGWQYIDPATGEYVDLTTEGIAVHSDLTVVGQVIVFTKQYDVTVASNDESMGTVQWYDSEGNEIQAPSVKAYYRSEVYTQKNILYLNDIEGEATYTAVATPAAMTEKSIYVLEKWELDASQVLNNVSATAVFAEMDPVIEYLGVIYKIQDIDGNVVAIGFNADSQFTVIEIPDVFEYEGWNLTPVSVEASAFIDCTVVDMAFIGANVAEIGDLAFSAPYLTSITVSADNEYYSSVKGVLYDKEVKTLLQYPLSKQRLIIPDTVTTIADSAFAGAGVGLKEQSQTSKTYLRYISIPSNVATIGDNAFKGCTVECLKFEDGVTSIGASAFAGCTALNYIVFPYSIESAGADAFDGCVFHGIDGRVMEYSAEDFKGYKFTSDSDYTELDIYVPELHGSIHQDGYIYRIVSADGFLVKVYGFDGESIAEVSIPVTITYLGFEYTITGVMSKAFYSDKTITSVVCYGDIGNKAFANCSNIETLTVNGASAIGDYAFAYCDSLVDADFGDTLSKIGKSAFFGCTSLDSFDLSGVSVIGERAFARCPLTEANLQSATDIGLGAFTGTALESVVFGDALENVDSRAFYGYAFLDIDGNKLKVTAENMASKAFSGDGGNLTQVLL